SGESGRRVGFDFQFCWRKISVEIPAADSVSRASLFWKAAAVNRHGAGGPPRCARSRRGSVWAPQEAHAHVAPVIRLFGTTASFPLRNGRRAKTETEVVRCAGRSCGACAEIAKALAGTGDGRYPSAAIGSRRACEFRRHVDGQSARQPELHGFE